jgi:superoxide dismutase, Fe-Mn family
MYEPKNFEEILGTPGLSDRLLNNHFTLYQGYISNINKLDNTLDRMEKDNNFTSAEYAELNRRFGWEWNGMRLHEYYFENISKEPAKINKDSELYKKIENKWKSFENWEKDFKAMAAMRGIGWVVLYLDKESEKLFNVWINEHDTGHLSGCKPILVMDVFEHSYMTDYGIKKADYIPVFWNAIDWNVVEKRFR